ncbi:MAG: DinB family protein [Acidobacteriia bacterium]|nr:DinB family protein [Terriglobia bacterium]
MKRLICLALLCLAVPLMSQAQDAAANPLSTTVRKILTDNAKNLVAGAEAMPAEKYSFQPSPDIRTFGQVIAHVAMVNNNVCAMLFKPAAPMPEKIAETDPKEKLVAGLKASMDYCDQAFSKLTDANLTEMIPSFGGRQMTRMGVALIVTNDLIDHYAGMAIYLRMNKVLPPTAMKMPM